MEYVCKVGTPTGEVMERRFTAKDEASLRADLEQKGFYHFAIHRGLRLGELRFRSRRVPNDLLVVFGQELAALLKAALPLFQSLDVMLERQRHQTFRASLLTIRDRVRAGAALSEAFRADGDLYPPILPASLVAGERSGSLEVVLRSASDNATLTLDGQVAMEMRMHDAIRVEAHPRPARLIRVAHRGFCEVLHRKLGWGER